MMYMSSAPVYLRSLLLASILSFIAPLLFVGSTLLGLVLVSFIPGLDPLSNLGSRLIFTFLETFGNGSALEGLLVIGGACGVVGALFDTYIFYRQHSFRRQ